MPGPKGKLTAAELERVDTWIRDNGSRMKECAVCGSTEWGFVDSLSALRDLGGPSSHVPTLLLLCKTCGYLRIISALGSGIVKKADSEDRETTPTD